jgi:hypothetical protein
VTVQLVTKSLLAEADGDPPRLVLRQHPRLPDFDFVVAGTNVGYCPPVGIAFSPIEPTLCATWWRSDLDTSL